MADTAQNKLKITFFTDLHHADKDHGCFNCLSSLKKLSKIVEKTADSDYYVSLGDFVDYLDDEKRVYKEAVEFADAQGLKLYRGVEILPKMLFPVLGNHEAAFTKKQELSNYINYEEGVGSVYSYKIGDVLFVVTDSNYNRYSVVDDPPVMQNTTEFTMPSAQIEWVKKQLKANVGEDTGSIVWLSHVAFKDIDEASRTSAAAEFLSYGKPVYLFEGHTHVERFYEEKIADKTLNIYTLAPVTYEFTIPVEEKLDSYFYYTVTFANGKIESVEKFHCKL